MKSILKLLSNGYFIGYMIFYMIILVLMWKFENYPLSEPLASLIIIGVVFSTVAWLVSKSSTLLSEEPPAGKHEAFVLFLLIIYITLFLSWGTDFVSRILPASWSKNPSANEIVVLIKKILFFVIIPVVLYNACYHYKWRDFGFTFKSREIFTKKNLRIFFVMSAMLLLFQLLAGNGGAPFREGYFSNSQLLLGLPLFYCWLIFEVGLVEELFFRVILQSRISVILRSKTGGILISGLIFGLCHAPGFYLRGSGNLEGLGTHPSLFMSIGFSVLVLSLAGIFLGIIWSRTRNIWLVIFTHAIVDLVPGLIEFVTKWNIK